MRKLRAAIPSNMSGIYRIQNLKLFLDLNGTTLQHAEDRHLGRLSRSPRKVSQSSSEKTERVTAIGSPPVSLKSFRVVAFVLPACHRSPIMPREDP